MSRPQAHCAGERHAWKCLGIGPTLHLPAAWSERWALWACAACGAIETLFYTAEGREAARDPFAPTQEEHGDDVE